MKPQMREVVIGAEAGEVQIHRSELSEVGTTPRVELHHVLGCSYWDSVACRRLRDEGNSTPSSPLSTDEYS